MALAVEIKNQLPKVTVPGLAANMRSLAPGAGSVQEASLLLRAGLAGRVDDLWNSARSANDGPVDVIDMFSGCGGMSAGFRMINGLLPAFRQILAIDIEPSANKTLAMNLGLTPENLDIHELASRPGSVTELLSRTSRRPDAPLVLIGCSPCQGFSSHRNAAGEADGRNNLFVDFAMLATEMQPDFVVVENVPELLTERYWPVVKRAKDILKQAGYAVHLSVHNMAEFGVPQERFRALMLASKRPFDPLVGHLARSDFRTVRQAIGSLAAIQPGEANKADPMHITAGHRDTTVATIRAIPPDGGSRTRDQGPDSLRALHQRQGKAAYEDVYGRLAWDRPSITITAYSRNPASGRFVHPEQHRGLSVREAALLQGFPSSYQFSGSFDERFRQIGNAVPPIFAANLAVSLLAQLAEAPSSYPDEGITKPVAKSFSRLIPSLKAGSLRLARAIQKPELHA